MEQTETSYIARMPADRGESTVREGAASARVVGPQSHSHHAYYGGGMAKNSGLNPRSFHEYNYKGAKCLRKLAAGGGRKENFYMKFL